MFELPDNKQGMCQFGKPQAIPPVFWLTAPDDRRRV